MNDRSGPTTSAWSLSVPANLLLMGEYAVLEDGGLGFAVAPDIRARARYAAAEPGSGPHVDGRAGTTDVRWPGDTGLLGRTAQALLQRFGTFDGRIEVDTTEFFAADGRKRGLGSSAAMTVALAALWSRIADGRVAEPERLAAVAIEVHRSAQGGRGSGYDVATSALGGHVCFVGGKRPRAQRITLGWLPPLVVYPGAAPVATTGAVAAYLRWRNTAPRDAAAYLEHSNRLVRDFVDAGSWQAARPVFEEYRETAAQLGAAIGAPARIGPPQDEPQTRTFVWKAVGAGDELGVCLLEGAPASSGMAISAEGVLW